jgi:hypothetical protein
MELSIEQAKNLLNAAERSELRDHAFGDVEVYWSAKFQGQIIEIASGYFGSGVHDGVTLYDPRTMLAGDIQHEAVASFTGKESRELRNCGTVGAVERNDSTGPDEFVTGQVMPGLSKGDVFHELTGSYLDDS